MWPSYLEQSSVGLFAALACPFGLSLLQRILLRIKLTFPSDELQDVNHRNKRED